MKNYKLILSSLALTSCNVAQKPDHAMLYSSYRMTTGMTIWDLLEKSHG